ncbi:MAG TPA: sigma-54 dependent transcriptional regulator [Methylomirabilota bacterium]|jgi:DNA-binding NtrC family response regulator|nr:sigma-54 dependent transcriptional regulator [Methylomirabilota bacterium]
MKPRVLVVDDEPIIADNLSLTLHGEGYDVETAANSVEAMLRLEKHDFALALVDLVLPDGDGLHLLRLLKGRAPSIEVIIMTGHSSISKAVEATKQGAFYFVAKPFDSEEMLMLVAKALERQRLLAEALDLRRKLAEQSAYGEMLGSSSTMKRVFDLLDSVAASDANVLIIGESGTGKELVANAVHAKSPRAEGPLVKINCAALPKDLIESELFGHVKGAFTGASTDKPGLLEEAHRGSLLLDEITEMPLDLQAKLLRVLEDHTVRRLGGSKSLPVDFRLICSTNLDPDSALREGRLRQDLYFRINTVTVAVPPLRERAADIAVLAKAFLERFRTKHGREIEGIEPEAYRRLLAYPWPGNVRELEHALERAVLVARGREITLGDLPESLQAEVPAGNVAAPPAGSLEEIERVSIVRALESTGWNKQAAAALLGLRRPTLYSKMRRHSIPQRRAN